MIQLYSINLIITDVTTLYNTNGSVAGILQPGNYVAEMNSGQQGGWYSLYEADNMFQKTSQDKANVYLHIDHNRQVFLYA